MSWVPFHSSLREGDKRGFSRSTRFIYLELSLLSRPTGGRLALPRGFRSVADAVHDILGGNRREIREALAALTVPLRPDDVADRALIVILATESRHEIIITAHEKWVHPDTSAERVRRFRAKQTEQYPIVSVARNVTEPVTETVTGNGCNANVTLLEERRGEERKGEDSAARPQPTLPVEIPEPKKSATKRRKREQLPLTFLPEDWRPSARDAADVTAKGLDLEAVVLDFRGYWRGLGEASADWNARFQQNTGRIMRTPWLRERLAAPVVPFRVPLRVEPTPAQLEMKRTSAATVAAAIADLNAAAAARTSGGTS